MLGKHKEQLWEGLYFNISGSQVEYYEFPKCVCLWLAVLWWRENKNAVEIQRNIKLCSALPSANNTSCLSTTKTQTTNTKKNTIFYSSCVFCWDWSLGTISGLSSCCLILRFLRVCGVLFRPLLSMLSKTYMCLLFSEIPKMHEKPHHPLRTRSCTFFMNQTILTWHGGLKA